MISVLHVPLIIANNSIVLSKYLKKLSVNSTVISFFRTWLNYSGDINLELDSLSTKKRNEKIREFFISNKKFFNKFDIIHYHFFDTITYGQSFGGWNAFPENNPYWELEYFKNLGKKIVVSSWGSDVRNNSRILMRQFQFVSNNETPLFPPLNTYNQYFKIWEFSKYTDAIVSGGVMANHVPYFYDINIPIDLDNLKKLSIESNKKNKNTNIKIIHAYSNNLLKGTKFITYILEKVKRNYPQVDIEIISQIPYNKFLKLLSQDRRLVISQISTTFGLFALESMYLGNPVICSQNPKDFFLSNDAKLNAPIISAENMDDLYNKIVYYIKNFNALPDFTNIFRNYIIENFSAEKVAKDYYELYKKILDNEKIKFYINNKWYEEFDMVLKNNKIGQEYYINAIDNWMREKDFERALFECNQAIKLADDFDILARTIIIYKLSGKTELANKLLDINKNVINTIKFKELYKYVEKKYKRYLYEK